MTYGTFDLVWRVLMRWGWHWSNSYVPTWLFWFFWMFSTLSRLICTPVHHTLFLSSFLEVPTWSRNLIERMFCHSHWSPGTMFLPFTRQGCLNEKEIKLLLRMGLVKLSNLFNVFFWFRMTNKWQNKLFLLDPNNTNNNNISTHYILYILYILEIKLWHTYNVIM